LIVQKCNAAGKPVIVATQMLNSMTESPVPTRAEVNDVANAILDGADAVMLSEETAIGKFPIKAVETMALVARHTEDHFPYEQVLQRHHRACKDTTCAITYATVHTAHELGATAIVALSESGFTARMIARYRPSCPVLIVTPSKRTYSKLALKFNSYPVLAEQFDTIDAAVKLAKSIAVEKDIARKGDTVVLCAGVPFAQGNTNLLFVQEI